MALVAALCACGEARRAPGGFLAVPDVVQTQLTQRGYDRRDEPVRKLAVAPFHAGARLVLGSGEEAGSLAAALVGHQLAEAHRKLAIDVIPPEDMRRALRAADADPKQLGFAATAELAGKQFGADALLIGEVLRFREREGSAMGSRRGASVAFTVTVYAAGGGRLWTAGFDQTQHPLSENVLTARRYPGGGTRWLTAEEMVRWGAESVAAAFPFKP